MKNLWPDNFIENEHKITPKEFLSRQINFLSETTNGKLIGALSSNTSYPFMDKLTKDDFDNADELFIHTMKVQSPSLGYSFTLLRLAHPTLKLFPFAVYSSLTDKKYIGNNIDELEGILLEIFRSTEVVDALTALSSQSDE